GLLIARAVLGLVGAAVVVGLARWGRVRDAIVVAGSAGVASIGLIALAGHAAAYASPVPVVVMGVHLVAAGTWVRGVLALADLAVFGQRPRRAALRPLVPRFSALALVAVAIIGLTGLYGGWLETGDPLGDPGLYAFALRLKTLAFLGALGFGALNYL